MRLRFSSLSLLTKIMLSTSVAITVLFAIAGQIVLRNITKTMSDSLEEEVQGSFHAYTSLWNARAELLNSVSRMLASMSGRARRVRHRAIRPPSGTRASEMWSRISTSAGLFLVTDPRGQGDRVAGRRTAPSLRKDLDLVQSAEARFPQQSSGFFLRGGELYHLSVTPVYVQSGRRAGSAERAGGRRPGGRDWWRSG